MLVGLGLLLGIAPAWAHDPPALELARRLGCFACHSQGGRGGKIGVSLDGVGSRLGPGQLETVLSYPRQIHPGARMPSYAYLPAGERRALVEFLERLK